METKFYDENGNELMAVSVNGILRIFTNKNRVLYTGPVKIETNCENNVNPCDQQPKCGCDCKGVAPGFLQRPSMSIQGYKQNGEYNLEEVKSILNFEDTLPEGVCSDEKYFIFCNDAVVACRWHLEDRWIIGAIFDVPFLQTY